MALGIVDVSALSQEAAWEFRRELIHAIRNPGLEYDETGQEGADDEKAYKDRLAEVDAHLATFSPRI